MNHSYIFILLSCFVLFLPACSKQTSDLEPASPEFSKNGESDEKKLELHAIIVLPTEHDRIKNEFNTEQIESLSQGAQILTKLLAAYFSENPKVIILSTPQVDTYLGSYIGHQLKEARYIGMQAGADAVLISQIHRFRELEGKEYGANAPASVSFDYQLLHLKSGKTLCRGTFEETQQTLLSNLFNFGKASKRNFKFVKGATLLEEGIEQKFSQCSHLNR